MEKKEIKVAAKQGAGRSPGYVWHIWMLDVVYKEATKFLSAAQYRHMALQVRELASEDDPTHSQVVDVKKIEDFYEIRDKGGVLGNLNVRVFFGVDYDEKAIVILGSMKKEADGPTPQGDKIRMRRRWRKYNARDYGPKPSQERNP